LYSFALVGATDSPTFISFSVTTPVTGEMMRVWWICSS
jgi:hypothetical protein